MMSDKISDFAWSDHPKWSRWVRPVEGDKTKIFCAFCHKIISGNSRIISRHADTKKHLEKETNYTTSLSSETSAGKISTSKIVTSSLPSSTMLLEPPPLAPLSTSTTPKPLASSIKIVVSSASISKPTVSLATSKPIDSNASLVQSTTASNPIISSVPITLKVPGSTTISYPVSITIPSTSTPLQNSSDMASSNNSLSTSESFRDQVKIAECMIASFVAEKNFPTSLVGDMVKLFQTIPTPVLKSVKLGRTKCTGIINHILCPIETNGLVEVLQSTKFSVFVNEVSDLSRNKWLSFMVKFVDKESLAVKTSILKLQTLNAGSCSGENIFKSLNRELTSKEIPIKNILALSAENSSSLIGDVNSFEGRLSGKNKCLITFPCVCNSAALALSAACATFPSEFEELIKGIATFNFTCGKMKRIFSDVLNPVSEESANLLKSDQANWLNRLSCVKKILGSYESLRNYLLYVYSSTKDSSARKLFNYLLSIPLKAYLLFFEYIATEFDSYYITFQKDSTLVHELQPTSLRLLLFLANKFLRPTVVKTLSSNEDLEFSDSDNQLPLDEIYLGATCEEFLRGMVGDDILNVRATCLQFYITASQQLHSLLPCYNPLLCQLSSFDAKIALYSDQRDASFENILSVHHRLIGVPSNEKALRQEWNDLYWLDLDVKTQLAALPFDEMWCEICLSRSVLGELQFPILKSLLEMVRTLPHSNCVSEEVFSMCFDLMSSDVLYAKPPVPKKPKQAKMMDKNKRRKSDCDDS